MTWLEYHKKSEELAAEAGVAARADDLKRARDLYEQAAQYEEKALTDLEPDKTRTIGITVVSAVSLFYKAAQYKKAELLAHKWLAVSTSPSFSVEQLRGLLQSIWSEQIRERAGVCLLYTSPSPRDRTRSRMPSSA